MKFIPIFAGVNADLWSVCYPESQGWDAFRLFLRQINSFEFLKEYFTLNSSLLTDSFWNNLSVEEAILQVIDEAFDLERELKCLETREPECAGVSFREVFEPLDKSHYFLQSKNRSFRKVRSNPDYFDRPMLRLYAVRLDDEALIITGGAIKLTQRMEGAHSEIVFKRLNKVKDYLSTYKIVSREGLL